MKIPEVHIQITTKTEPWRPAEPGNDQAPVTLSAQEWLRLREIIAVSGMPSRRIFAMRTLSKLLALVPENERPKWEDL